MNMINISEFELEGKLEEFINNYDFTGIVGEESFNMMDCLEKNSLYFPMNRFVTQFSEYLLDTSSNQDYKYVMVGVSEYCRHERVSPKFDFEEDAWNYMIDSPHDFTEELVIKIKPDSVVEPISSFNHHLSPELIYYSECGAIEHRVDNFNIIHSKGFVTHPKDVIGDSYGYHVKEDGLYIPTTILGEANGKIYDTNISGINTYNPMLSELNQVLINHSEDLINKALTAKKWCHGLSDKDIEFYKD